MPYYPCESDQTRAAFARLEEARRSQEALITERETYLTQWALTMASASSLVSVREREYHQAMREANPEVKD